MSVQQDCAENEPKSSLEPLPAPEPLTDSQDEDVPPDPGPVTARVPVADAAASGQERGVGRHRTDRPGGYPLDPETIVLPAFLTGKREEPAHPQPARPQPGDKLPATERGMLVFVAALLALGTVGVVAMLGFGGLTARHAPAPAPTVSVTPVAGAQAAPTPSPAPSPSESPSASPSPTRPAPPPPPRRSPTPAVLLGGIDGLRDLFGYCGAKQEGRPVAPSEENVTWICAAGRNRTPFTPDNICSFRYHQPAHAMVGALTDPSTWTCYR